MTTGFPLRLCLPVFSFTLFLSAAAMFALQPMAGKMLLPLVGGTPAGWIVAMAFFQIMLLVGYLLAHLLSTLPSRRHGLAYAALLAIGVFFLPISIEQGAAGPAPGAAGVFRLLLLSCGVPFIALAMTSSTLQRLFTATGHPTAGDPYYLYAASNLGSFAGLFLYPLAIEPALDLAQQAGYWAWSYALLIPLGLGCTWLAGNSAETRAEAASLACWKTRIHWLALAFFPSSLLLGVTTHITTDIISAPMIWVLPLGLYLLTFVAAFARRQIVPAWLVQRFHPVVVAITVGVVTLLHSASVISWYGMLWHLTAFTIVALMCHMRLAELRPAKGGSLTEFYLMMSLGGALGGFLNAFIVPVTTTHLIEYPLMMMLTCFVNPYFKSPFSGKFAAIYFTAVALFLVFALLQHQGLVAPVWIQLFFLAVFIAVTLHPRASLIASLLLFFVLHDLTRKEEVRVTGRNFYGTVRVFDRVATDAYVDWHLRYMTHGTTIHGLQIRDEGHETQPTSYFARTSPLGEIFAVLRPGKVAVLGLGTGTINCHSTPETEMTFLEIDPLVVDIAKTQFSFLSACKGKTEPRIIVGDARLELEKLGAERFDLMIMDAFSSDMIPTHLITREAMRVYLDHLNEGGVIAVNISNRYFDLRSILAQVGEDADLTPRYKFDAYMYQSSPYTYPSQWIALTKNDAIVSALDGRKWEKVAIPPESRVWTDTYSSLLHVTKFSQ